MNEKGALFIGVGNILRADDAVGVVLARRLKGRINIIEAGITPENYLNKIIDSRPSEVWIIDCLDFSGSPGQWRIFKAEELASNHLFFTHNFSLELFCSYLKERGGLKISVLGIQPKSTKFSEALSKEVESVLPEIENKLLEIAEKMSNEPAT